MGARFYPRAHPHPGQESPPPPHPPPPRVGREGPVAGRVDLPLAAARSAADGTAWPLAGLPARRKLVVVSAGRGRRQSRRRRPPLSPSLSTGPRSRRRRVAGRSMSRSSTRHENGSRPRVLELAPSLRTTSAAFERGWGVARRRRGLPGIRKDLETAGSFGTVPRRHLRR